MSGTHVRHHEVPGRITARAGRLRHDRVLRTALGLILLQLAFRAWATYGSWYLGDDLAFISRMTTEGPDLSVAMRHYAGHIMPAGMYLSWLADVVAPFDYRVEATVLLGLQALADLGLLALLVRMFGVRPGILPPLALYLFSVVSVPMAVWWAAGVNQLPLQVALFWGLCAHVSYLRTGRWQHAVTAAAWVAGGLVFYEKTLLVLGAYGILALAYFAEGGLVARVRHVLVRYRTGVAIHGALGLGYLGLYVRFGLNFEPGHAGDTTLPEVASNMLVHGYLPGMVGGPLVWDETGAWALPDPGPVLMAAAVLVWVLVVREILRHRRRAARALALPAFFLGCDILLVQAGRASLVGPLISLDYRYQSELGAVTAIALALAVLPLRGATETVEATGRSPLLDDPQRAGAVVAAVGVLGLVSSSQYVLHWHRANDVKPYFDNLRRALDGTAPVPPLIDAPVPSTVMLGFNYPQNTLSHLLHAYADRTEFVESSTDHLAMVDQQGRIAPVVIPDTRRAEPGPRRGCGYRVASRPVTIPLDGPVAYGGWWMRIGYIASADSPVRVRAGDAAYTTEVEAGLHALYVRAGTSFDHVEISGLAQGASLCTNEVTVGRPVPRTEYAP
jgi:hypothetical protein